MRTCSKSHSEEMRPPSSEPRAPVPGTQISESKSDTSPSPSRQCHVCAQVLSRARLCATPRTVAHQAPLSLGFSWQEHWSGSHVLLQTPRTRTSYRFLIRGGVLTLSF